MSRQGIAYQPALDGVRAVSVLAVLLFHGGIAGFGGGYLGVSVFFTLSGFLITSLMLAEHASTGRVAIGDFYERRAKRLLPASLLCIAAIAVIAGTTDLFDGVEALRRDLFGAVAQVANWVFLGGSGSYQELLADTTGQASPVEHYWSLAIEEQFYWLWPLAFVGLHRIARSHRAATTVIGIATLVFALAAPAIAAVWGPDAAYWATPARAAEILTGVLLAYLIRGRTMPSRIGVVAPIALGVLAVAVVVFPSDGGPAYHGALPLVGVVSALLILGLQVPGPVRSVLSVRPLVWLGQVSYGVYLYHWPIYVLLDEQRTDLGEPALILVRLLVTFTLAVLSHRFVERPVRSGRITKAWRPRHTGVAALGATAVAVAVIVVAVAPGRGAYWQTPEPLTGAGIDPVGDATLPPLVAEPTATTAPDGTLTPPATTPTSSPSPPPPTSSPSTATTQPVPSTTTTASPSPDATAPLPELARPLRVLVAGDSTAEATGTGLALWALEQPDLAQVSVLAAPGCGFLRDGEMESGGWTPYTDLCRTYLDDRLPAETTALRPDVVMLMTSSWDVLDRRWSGGPTLTPFDEEFTRRLRQDFTAITDRVLAAGAAHVVWIRPPEPVPLWGFGGPQLQSDPARHDALAAVMAEIAADRPGQVSVVDLAAWVAAAGLAEDRDARPDGVHWDPEVAASIARTFLGDRLLRAAIGI